MVSSIWKVCVTQVVIDWKPATALDWMPSHWAMSCRPARVNMPAMTSSRPSRAMPLAAPRPRKV